MSLLGATRMEEANRSTVRGVFCPWGPEPQWSGCSGLGGAQGLIELQWAVL